MSYRVRSSSAEESISTIPGQPPDTISVHRAVLTLHDSSGDLEVTADGEDNLLEILKDSSALSDLIALQIAAEPEIGTPEHDDWEFQWAGLQAIPGNGAKVIIRATIEIECYEA